MTNKNTTLSIGVLFGIFGFASKLLYRPYILTNHVNDLGINEFAPSFFYTAGMCLIAAAFSKKAPFITMIAIALGSITYELEQFFTDRTFDIKDLIAVMVAFVTSIFIFKLVNPKGKSLN
jgi:hypothetical protein